jgi:acetate kinase
MRVVCLNSGSSSLKFAVYDFAQGEICLAADELSVTGDDIVGAVDRIWSTLDSRQCLPVSAVGHRVVFGGVNHDGPVRVDAALLAELRSLNHFAPLHLPVELAVIETAMRLAPRVPHVACFDTAFHRRMPDVAQRLPFPRDLWDSGLRRFGYHGLSYEYVVQALGADAMGRSVIAHLGNGASLAAVRDGRSVDTTMGLTPAGGLMMSTRSGDVDPGVLIHLMRSRHLDADAIERLVTREAGLAGVSGRDGDMQDLLARGAADEAAANAIEMFCYIARKHIGAMAAALGGVDSLVFTGGIGEHAAPIREGICAGLEHLGVRLNKKANERHADRIDAGDGSCAVHVIRTNENLMIARHTRALVEGSDD